MTCSGCRAHPLIVLGLLLPTLVGCGPQVKGPPRYVVSGDVTYNGRPVPKGFISFTPDASQGNSGPGGGAPIENGKYRTERKKGVVGGPHQVRIVGYTGVATSMEGEDLLDGAPLFTPYETTVDFPDQATSMNFDIPKEE